MPLRSGVCCVLRMATNVAIDEELLERAHELGGQKTKIATVTVALREYVRRRQQASIIALFGKIDFDADYDYKQQRRGISQTELRSPSRGTPRARSRRRGRGGA